jgi:hypothetical protein
LDYQLGSVLGLPGLPEAGPGTAPGLRLPGLPALRPGLEPEFGSAPGPGYWPPSGLAGENAQVEKALAEVEPAEGALSEGLAVELAGPLKVVGRH